MADDAGALLVRSGLVSSSALEDARSRVANQGGTLGEQLVATGAISDEQLTEFYRQRLLVPQVNPNTLARLPQKVVMSIPGDMAIELRAIPVSLDGDNNLTVAMSDPSDRHAVDEISFFTGTYVVRAVATQMQIAWCLAHYYGHVTVLGARLIQPQRTAPESSAPAQTAPRARTAPPAQTAPRVRTAPPAQGPRARTAPPAQTAQRARTAPPAQAAPRVRTAPPAQTAQGAQTAPPAQAVPRVRTAPPAQTAARAQTAPPAQTASRTQTAPPAQTASRTQTAPPAQTASRVQTAPPAQTVPRAQTAPPAQTALRAQTAPPAQTAPRAQTAPPAQTAPRAQTAPPAAAAAAATAPAPAPAPVPPAPQADDAAARAMALRQKINASRHHAIPPGFSLSDLKRPLGRELDLKRPIGRELDEAVAEARAIDEKVTETMTAVMPAPEAPTAPPPPDVTAPEIRILEVDEPPEPARPGARSTAGELRQPSRQRAASIRPPVPDPHLGEDEDDEPMISIEERAADDKGPRMMPLRRRVKTDPPELKARAGEVSLDKRPDRSIDDQPRIIIEDDALVPVSPVSGELRATTHRDREPPTSSIELEDTSVNVVIDPSLTEVPEEIPPEPSEPVLLDQRRTTDVPLAAPSADPSDDGPDTVDDEVVVLAHRKVPTPAPAPMPAPAPAPAPRPVKRTQVGIGALPAVTQPRRDTSPPATPFLGDVMAKDAVALPRTFADADDELTKQARALEPGDDDRTGRSRAVRPRADDRTAQTLAAPPDADDVTNPRITLPQAAMPAAAAAAAAAAGTAVTQTAAAAVSGTAATAPATQAITPEALPTSVPTPVPTSVPTPVPTPVIVRPRGAARPQTPPPERAPTDEDGNDDSNDDRDDAAQEEDELTAGPATSVMSIVELDAAIPQRRAEVIPGHLERGPRITHDPIDDGWGTGSTIPPPRLSAQLVALPGSDDDTGQIAPDRGRITAPTVSAVPLFVMPPSPSESMRGALARSEASGPTLARALEEATSRVIELIRALERAKDRDAVVTLMIEHLTETHQRAGFFAVRPSAEAGKAGELAVFKIKPPPPAPSPVTLRLDRPSTLQDVVDTRLPYRGPMHDDASRTFLAAVLGACPPEILLVPVTVRERVVGVLFGEHRLRHTFDDQLALAARAIGMALERILLAKRG